MFTKLFGKDDKRTEDIYNEKIARLFSTQEGQEILTWLIKTNILDINISNTIDMSHIAMAYKQGRIDFIKLLIKLTDHDFSNTLKG